MSDYGINPAGFRIKQFEEIRKSLYDRLSQVKDPDSGETLQVDFDENDPIVNIVNAFIDSLSQHWKMMAQVYEQFNPSRASGDSLSGLVQLNGLLRKKGSPSSVILTFTGEPGRVIKAGTIVYSEDDDSIKWRTANEVLIEEDSTASVIAYSVDNGSFLVPPGTINKIFDVLVGINSVVNESSSIPGTIDETDEELRIRRERSVATPSRGTIESIVGGLQALNGVNYVKVFSNRETDTDEKGIPGKHMAVIVQGGDDKEIAKEIFIRAGATTDFYGDTSVQFIDSFQQATTVSFTRPKPVNIRVNIRVSDLESVSMNSNYEQEIVDNIIRFAEKGPAGLGLSTEFFDDYGFPPSENVAVSRLYIPINVIKGCKIIDLKIAREDNEFSTEDVIIDWNEVALFSAENINIVKE